MLVPYPAIYHLSSLDQYHTWPVLRDFYHLQQPTILATAVYHSCCYCCSSVFFNLPLPLSIVVYIAISLPTSPHITQILFCPVSFIDLIFSPLTRSFSLSLFLTCIPSPPHTHTYIFLFIVSLFVEWKVWEEWQDKARMVWDGD